MIQFFVILDNLSCESLAMQVPVETELLAGPKKLIVRLKSFASETASQFNLRGRKSPGLHAVVAVQFLSLQVALWA